MSGEQGRVDYRDLPAVEENVDAPERLSQTLLAHADNCARAAYLYLRWGGGGPAHELARGTAFHMFAERAMRLMLETGEARPDPDMAKELMNAVLREHPELQIPWREADDLHEMAYHWSVGLEPIDLAAVAGVEQRFYLDVGEWTVSMILDLAMIDGTTGRVRDYKTMYAPPTQDEVDATFQLRLYALGLAEGHPVMVGEDGERVALPPVGGHLEWFDLAEVFPRALREDGTMVAKGPALMSRLEVLEVREHLVHLVERVEHGLSTGRWPAVHGSHCSRCPARAECPLDPVLLNHAGSINSFEEAAEAAVWAERTGDVLDATRKELRLFVKARGPVRFGRDRVLEVTVGEKWATDWPGIEAGVDRATRWGEAFDLGTYRRRQVSSSVKGRSLTPAELEEEARDGE